MDKESQILLEEPSPCTDVRAIVEDDGESIYFYLYGPLDADDYPAGLDNEHFSPLRTCWISSKRQTFQKDVTPILERMREGKSPIVPEQFCKADAYNGIDASKLELVWFEEGDAAALLHKGKIVGVIPTWGVLPDGRHGYSAALSTPFLDFLPIEQMPQEMHQRIAKASKFWKSWLEDGVEERFFNSYYQSLKAAFGGKDATEQKLIENGRWPPKVVNIFEHSDVTIFATVGTSILAQPRVEVFTENPQPYRRIELAMLLPTQLVHEISIEPIIALLQNLAFAPWDKLIWFHDTHKISYPLDFLSQKNGENFTALALTKEIPNMKNQNIVNPTFASYQNDPVTLLWITPIIESERTNS